MNQWIIFIVLFKGSAAFAASAQGNEIPSVTLWQVVNLAILFTALIYLLKDTVKNQFATKRSTFLAEAERSKAARHEAEKTYLETKKKLADFNSSVEASLARARKEAQELALQITADAKAQAVRINEEAMISNKNENLKAQRRLHSQVVSDVIGMARSVLSKDIGSSDHQKLQNDFSKNIQAVSP